MPRFRYKARNLKGRAAEGELEATDDDELEKALARQGLMLISAAPAGQAKKSLFSTGAAGAGLSLSTASLIFFTAEMGTSYRAGLSVLSTLDDMQRTSDSRLLRRLAAGLSDRVRDGATLAEALSAFPRAFPTLYVELIAAAEKTGRLDRTFEDLVRLLEWQRELRSQVVGATIYPITVLAAVLMLVPVLTLFVLPRFLSSFANSKVPLPLPTQILLFISDFFRDQTALVVAVLVGVPVLYLLVRRVPVVRRTVDLIKLKMPVTGPLLTKILMSRFAHNFSMMITSGLGFGTALLLSERLMSNTVLAALIADARVDVEQGKPLSEALARGNYIPPLVKRMLHLGETTGKMEESLANVTRFFDNEVPKSIKTMFAILTPLVLVFMAGVVLFMAAAVLLPIYSMINHI